MKNDKKEKKEEKSFFSQKEEGVLEYWKKNKIFQKSVGQRSEAKKFIFFEGPPTANGKPGIHHVLARSYKDIICRYKTMQGFKVERKAGWDTHGLPVELQVEKELKISSKPEIEKFGIEEFNKKCKDSVWHYKDEWERLTERMAYWLDLEHPYITYSNEYIESVWNILAEINRKGLLYEGHKVVPYCSRCGTGLSSHEVAQGYKTVKDLSVIVKFKITDEKFLNKHCAGKETYFLAWTTTPWSVPTTMALAIGADYNYVILRKEQEQFICVKERVSYIMKDVSEKEYEIVNEIKGKDMEYISYYHPFYEFYKEHKDIRDNSKVYKTYITDYVSLEDGTGIVTINGAFGEIDMEAVKKIGLPVIVNVNPDGTFMEEMKEFAGMKVKPMDEPEKTDVEIIKFLAKQGTLFRKEKHEHSYPHCWRCNTKLIYYAKKSWFIKMTDKKIKKALIKNNSEINWVPEYIKEGRMGEWLRDVKDWALSRERYWGTPLPVWKCQSGKFQNPNFKSQTNSKTQISNCDNIKMIESIDELREKIDGKVTKLIFLRHGESGKNIEGVNSDSLEKYPLTEEGIKHAEKASSKLKDSKIDVIITSPVLRARQTAEIINKKLNVKIITNDLVTEYKYGSWNDKTKKYLLENDELYRNYKKIDNLEEKYNFVHGGDGESRAQMEIRIKKFIDFCLEKYPGKNILVVSHGGLNGTFKRVLSGISINDFFVAENALGYCDSEIFYINKKGKEFNLHRPYIDEVKFKCEKCKGEMVREKDVIDCWFDSGAMPFAQWHYPFENKDFIDKGEKFPADYISEAIDQTRGWFYTLLAISTLLEKGAPYKNVITYGHILDDKGQKMSKSKGNVVDPWLVADKYGIDMLRWYFYTIGAPGEPKRFDFKEMEEIRNKFFRAYWNSFVFYETYKNIKKQKAKAEEPNILDAWIVLCLDEVIDLAAKHLENYDVMHAARLIAEFIDELSNKYIRFSRDRMRSGEAGAIDTLREVLVRLTKITAPFVPFISEEIYRNVKEAGASESVHLADWPTPKKPEEKTIGLDKGIAKDMQGAFAIVDLGRTARVFSKIPVRQALAAMEIQGSKFENKELEELIKKELNIKKIVFKDKITDKKEFVPATNNNITVALDTVLTEELREEGLVRELIRQIQDLRKNSKYTIKDLAEMYYNTDSATVKKALEAHKDAIKQKTILSAINSASKIEKKSYDAYKDIKIDGVKVEIGLKKV